MMMRQYAMTCWAGVQSGRLVASCVAPDSCCALCMMRVPTAQRLLGATQLATSIQRQYEWQLLLRTLCFVRTVDVANM